MYEIQVGICVTIKDLPKIFSDWYLKNIYIAVEYLEISLASFVHFYTTLTILINGCVSAIV